MTLDQQILFLFKIATSMVLKDPQWYTGWKLYFCDIAIVYLYLLVIMTNSKYKKLTKQMFDTKFDAKEQEQRILRTIGSATGFTYAGGNSTLRCSKFSIIGGKNIANPLTEV